MRFGGMAERLLGVTTRVPRGYSDHPTALLAWGMSMNQPVADTIAKTDSDIVVLDDGCGPLRDWAAAVARCWHR